MEAIEAKSRSRLLVDNEEFPIQAKIPYDEQLLGEAEQPRSIYLSALSNDLGLLIYAMGSRLMVINQDGLLNQFKDAKDAGNSEKHKRPTMEAMKSKGQLVTIAFSKDITADEPITRILLEEEYTGKTGRLAIGFKSKVIVIEASSILKGDAQVISSFLLSRGSGLKTFCFVGKNLILIDDSGKAHLAMGDLKLSPLQGMNILDCKHGIIEAHLDL